MAALNVRLKRWMLSWGVNFSSPAHLPDSFIIYDPMIDGTGDDKCRSGGGQIDVRPGVNSEMGELDPQQTLKS